MDSLFRDWANPLRDLVVRDGDTSYPADDAPDHILGWHIIPGNGRLTHPKPDEFGMRPDGELVVVGGTYAVEGDLEVCNNGLHYCTNARAAIHHAAMSMPYEFDPILCRVRVSQERVWRGRGQGQGCARRRHVIAMAPAKMLLHRMALDCLGEMIDREQALLGHVDSTYRLYHARYREWIEDDHGTAGWEVLRRAYMMAYNAEYPGSEPMCRGFTFIAGDTVEEQHHNALRVLETLYDAERTQLSINPGRITNVNHIEARGRLLQDLTTKTAIQVIPNRLAGTNPTLFTPQDWSDIRRAGSVEQVALDALSITAKEGI